jgi:hypothetical protein
MFNFDESNIKLTANMIEEDTKINDKKSHFFQVEKILELDAHDPKLDEAIRKNV